LGGVALFCGVQPIKMNDRGVIYVYADVIHVYADIV
jgi:hypothetical protein